MSERTALPFGGGKVRMRIRSDVLHVPLYRYLDAQHADEMMATGTVKVSTLLVCGRHGADAARTDAGEGTRSRIYLSPSEPTPQEQLPEFAQQLLGGSGMRSNGIYVQETEPTWEHDYYVLCMSESLDETLFQRFKADACIRIDQLEPFIKALTWALRDRVQEAVTVSPIFYGNRSGWHDRVVSDVPEQWVKPNRFAIEREVRAIWTPIARPITAEFPRLINIGRYATRVL